MKFSRVLRDVIVDIRARKGRVILLLTGVALSCGVLITAIATTLSAARQIDADLSASGTTSRSSAPPQATCERPECQTCPRQRGCSIRGNPSTPLRWSVCRRRRPWESRIPCLRQVSASGWVGNRSPEVRWGSACRWRPRRSVVGVTICHRGSSSPGPPWECSWVSSPLPILHIEPVTSPPPRPFGPSDRCCVAAPG